MEKLFKKYESDQIKKGLSSIDPQKLRGKMHTWDIITEKVPVILNSESKDKIVRTFLPEIQNVIGDRFSLSFLRNDDDPLSKRSYVKVYLEDKNATFVNSGLSAPFFELSESPVGDHLEAKIKISGKTESESVILSNPANLEESFKQVFTAFLNKYEKEY